jgi:thiol-disulfide isomerase/thioredoxin
VAFTTWQVLGLFAALLGVPNLAAKPQGADCNCVVTPLVGEWLPFLALSGLEIGLVILVPAVVLGSLALLSLRAAPRWILDRERFYRTYRRAALQGLLVALAVVGLLVGEYVMAGGGVAPTVAGRPAPSLEVTLTDGTQLALTDLEGKPTLLVFFATWCPHCRAEVEELRQVWGEIQGRANLLMVSTGWRGDDLEAVRQFQAELGIDWPVGLAEPTADVRFGVEAIPKLVLVSPELRVVWTHTGTIPAEEILEAINTTLG